MKTLLLPSLLFVVPAFAQINANTNANTQVNQQILNHLTTQAQTNVSDTLNQLKQTTTKSANSRLDEALLAISHQIKLTESGGKSGGVAKQVSGNDFAKLTDVVKTLQSLIKSSSTKDPVANGLLATQVLTIVNSSLSMVAQLTPAQRMQYSTAMMGVIDATSAMAAQADAKSKTQLTTSATTLKAVLIGVQAQTPSIIVLNSMYTSLKSTTNASAAAVQNLANQTAAIANAEAAQIRAIQTMNQNTLLILSNGLNQQLTNSLQSGLGNLNVVNDIINAAGQAKTAISNSNYSPP